MGPSSGLRSAGRYHDGGTGPGGTAFETVQQRVHDQRFRRDSLRMRVREQWSSRWPIADPPAVTTDAVTSVRTTVRSTHFATSDGTEQWRFEASSWVSSVVVVDGPSTLALLTELSTHSPLSDGPFEQELVYCSAEFLYLTSVSCYDVDWLVPSPIFESPVLITLGQNVSSPKDFNRANAPL